MFFMAWKICADKMSKFRPRKPSCGGSVKLSAYTVARASSHILRLFERQRPVKSPQRGEKAGFSTRRSRSQTQRGKEIRPWNEPAAPKNQENVLKNDRMEVRQTAGEIAKMGVYDRRTFLKRTGAAAMGAGLPGYVRLKPCSAQSQDEIPVRIETPGDPLVARTFSILKDRIQQRCPAKVIEAGEGAQIVLATDGGLPQDAFRIDPAGAAVRVAGGSPRGLLYGVGKFLRTSGYGETFRPSSWRGLSTPQGSVRGMYFATHFHNWYHQASEPEIARYIEDLALWGVNAVMAVFPMINLQDWNDPQAEPAMAMMRQYAKCAKTLGLQFVTGLNNTLFIGAPKEIRATPLPDPTRRRGNSGNPICPSNPAGHAYIMENSRILFEKLSDIGLDIVCFWPYDEGGCACEQCRPWGSNGYLKLSRGLAELGRRYFPDLKTILSTWMFDTPPEGEWQGLAEYMVPSGQWIDYILADSHEDFPRYPLDAGVPGNRPLLNFPEISMWGNWPWGGYGANPLPSRFQRLWDQVKRVADGGFPYSEGIYEDINKAAVVQFYWNREQSARVTLEEYIAYEFGPGVTEDVLEVIDALETAAGRCYTKEHVSAETARRAWIRAEAVNARLPDWARRNWRWEILYLRALLDRERFAGGGLETPEAEAAMSRLIELYHCQMETDDPYHHRVRPPLRRAVSRKGEC